MIVGLNLQRFQINITIGVRFLKKKKKNQQIGDIYFRKGKFELASENFEQALRLQSGNIMLMNNLAIAYMQQGRFDDAVKQWREALVIDPNSLRTHLNFAFALSEKSQHAQAIEHYNRALQLEPNQLGVLGKLAVSYASIGNYAQAVKVTEKALALAVMVGNNTVAEQIQKQLEHYKNALSSNKQ